VPETQARLEDEELFRLEDEKFSRGIVRLSQFLSIFRSLLQTSIQSDFDVLTPLFTAPAKP